MGSLRSCCGVDGDYVVVDDDDVVVVDIALVFCVDSTLCECGWAVTLPTGIARLPHTHNSVRMMMKVMRMVRMVLIRMVNHHW